MKSHKRYPLLTVIITLLGCTCSYLPEAWAIRTDPTFQQFNPCVIPDSQIASAGFKDSPKKQRTRSVFLHKLNSFPQHIRDKAIPLTHVIAAHLTCSWGDKSHAVWITTLHYQPNADVRLFSALSNEFLNRHTDFPDIGFTGLSEVIKYSIYISHVSNTAADIDNHRVVFVEFNPENLFSPLSGIKPFCISLIEPGMIISSRGYTCSYARTLLNSLL